jgi:hypothetical protein
MKAAPPIKARTNGGIMAIALLTVGFVSVGFTAWLGLLSQRSRAGEMEEHATRRRIAMFNSRAAIREYALERVITSSTDTDGFNFNPSELSGWSVTSSAAWSGYPMESNTRLAGLNAFSPASDYPYSKLLDVSAVTKTLAFDSAVGGGITPSYGTSSSILRAYVRSRSPLLGGDLLLIHRSKLTPEVAPAVTGNIIVNGRVVHFVPELDSNSYTARSSRFISIPGVAVNVSPKDLSGNAILPSNLSWTPITFGRLPSSAAADYSGKLNVLDDSTNGGNSLKSRLTASTSTIPDTGAQTTSDARGYSNSGTGVVTIKPCIGSTNPADLPSIVIGDEVQEIVIEGQSGANLATYAPYRPAFAVLYTQSASSVRKLTTIRLRGQNARRMLLAIKQAGNIPGSPINVIVEDSTPVCEWHMMIIAENTPIIVSLAGGTNALQLIGGIQTDGPLSGPTGSGLLSIYLQSDTRGLIRLAPRGAWVETIMPEKIPGTTIDNTW